MEGGIRNSLELLNEMKNSGTFSNGAAEFPRESTPNRIGQDRSVAPLFSVFVKVHRSSTFQRNLFRLLLGLNSLYYILIRELNVETDSTMRDILSSEFLRASE